MKRELVGEYRAKACAERARAAAEGDAKAAEAAIGLAASYDREADAYESLLKTRQDNHLTLLENGGYALG